MNCDKFKHYIVDFHAGEIGSRERLELEMHMKSCENCRRDFKECDAIIRNSRKISPPVFDDEYWRKKREELAIYRKERRFLLKPVLAAVAAMVLISVLLHQFLPGRVGNNMLTERKKNTFVFNTLPVSEDRLLEMADYIDEKSARDMLDILSENDVHFTFYSSN
ncbi:MAG TPA: zf-HC2 domain-containing protein [bacterium]|nr:zf-HC2 domain-containing protein [bacterium]